MAEHVAAFVYERLMNMGIGQEPNKTHNNAPPFSFCVPDRHRRQYNCYQHDNVILLQCKQM